MSETTRLLQQKIKDLFSLPDLRVQVEVPERQFGDYTTNAAMVAGKMLGRNPLECAEDMVAGLLKDEEVTSVFGKIEAVKPGFVNFSLAESYLLEILQNINKQPEVYGSSDVGRGKLVLVEYFQLNAAKPPHVGHLRSAIIGDSLKRIFISQGYKTISDTHIGDWGTQFGMLLWGYKNLNGREKIKENPLEELNELYVEVNNLIAEKPEIRDEAKNEFVKLEQGNEENRKLWEFFVSISKVEFTKIAGLLNLLPFNYDLGESFYEDRMKEIVKRLEAKGLLKVGETGERYIDLEEYKLGRLIALKSDGATTYELRDLATVAYRFDELTAKEKTELIYNLYVVDNRQAHDFRQVFKVMELLGYDTSKCVHVDYGFLSLPEGAMSTRKGTVIRAEALIEEATIRALQIIEEKNHGLANKAEVAKKVALGGLKYADLSHNRKTDIVFRWEEALTFEGDTGPYLQYTHARLKSILRKSNTEAKSLDLAGVHFEEKSEQALARFLVHFPEILLRTTHEFQPNAITHYLYELASLVNSFYQEVQVLAEEDTAKRNGRLALVWAAASVLHNGLYLLGIDAPEEM